MQRVPITLCIGGHDPSGGAGVQADIETVMALGGRAMSLITSLTAQDTQNIQATRPVDADFLRDQLALLRADVPIDAIKIGLIADAPVMTVIHELITDFNGPVVIDPVLAAGGGFDLDQNTDLASRIREELLPHTTLLTPNRREARRLTGVEDPEASARLLLDTGAQAVLLTGADEAETDRVTNILLQRDGSSTPYHWPLLPHTYHGSGCTLAAACAAGLAAGLPLGDAVERAQSFTWQALRHGERVSDGQWLPWRRT